MRARVCATVSVPVRAQAPRQCVSPVRAANTDHAALRKKKERERQLHLGEGGCKVAAGRQWWSWGRVMAGRFSASRNQGNTRGRGFALAPRLGGVVHSGRN